MRPGSTFTCLLAAVSWLVVGNPSRAQETKARLDIYGYVMTDVGYNSEAIDPFWFDVQRPTKLPAVENQFGKDGSTFFSARQTRFGVKSYLPTDLGEVKTTFEWELFGTGEDAGQTTLRLRHAYGELGKFGVGQTWSPFMDIDVFPNTIEYWGPNGMVFFRNIQVRWMPMQGDSRMTVALERPGASADQGEYAGRVELEDAVARFPLPDLSAEYRIGRPWGYVELAGIVRWMEWDDLKPTVAGDISGDATGWGLNLSTNLKLGPRNVVRLQGVYGEGIENYMNDAPADLAIENDEGVAIPLLGIVAFLDHAWNDELSTSLGYSQIDIDNADGQNDYAFKLGQYALINLLYTPVPTVMMGIEAGWDRRENFEDGWDIDNYHVQTSFKYSFAGSMGGE